MTTYTNIPRAYSLWSDPATWQGGTVPNAPDADVQLSMGVSMGGLSFPALVTVPSGTSYAIRSLAVGTGADLGGSGTLAVAGQVTDSGLVFLSPGSDLATGGLVVAAGGSVLGQGEIDGDIVDNGTINASAGAGRLLLTGAVTGTGTLVVGPASYTVPPLGGPPGGNIGALQNVAVLELAGATAAPVSFADGTGTLQLDNPATFTGTITPSPPFLQSGYSAAAPRVQSDHILLEGVPAGAVTGTSYSGDSTGGTLTIQEGATQQTLSFAGSYTAGSFVLGAGPQGVQPSLDLTVAPTPSVNAPFFVNSNGVITNSTTVTVDGTATAGALVSLSSGGVTNAASSYSPAIIGLIPANHPFSEAYVGPINVSPTPGLQTVAVTATATNPAGSAQSTGTVSVDLLPAPVNGITTAGVSTGDIVALENAGYGFSIAGLASGTEAIQFLNGTYSVGPDTNEALLQRLYFGLLGRPSDPGGLASFDLQLNNGASASTVADIMITSAEGTARGLPTEPADQYVRSLYLNLLYRNPSSAEQAGWVNVLGAGSTRGQVAAAIASSPESKARFSPFNTQTFLTDPQGAAITQLYQTAFGRDPGLGDLGGWKQQISAGLTPQALSQIIASSPEFAAHHDGQDLSSFVASLYETGLGRDPAPSETQGWVAQLQAGATPAAVVYDIGSSAEGAAHLTPAIRIG